MFLTPKISQNFRRNLDFFNYVYLCNKKKTCTIWWLGLFMCFRFLNENFKGKIRDYIEVLFAHYFFNNIAYKFVIVNKTVQLILHLYLVTRFSAKTANRNDPPLRRATSF